MAEKKTESVIVKLSPSKKSDWEKAVQKHPDATNLSSFIRGAVRRETARVEAGGETTGTSGSEEVIEGLREDIAGIDGELSRLTREIANLRDDLSGDPDFEELKTDVFGLIPTRRDLDGFDTRAIRKSDETEKQRLLDGNQPLDPPEHEWLADSGRPDVIARLLGERPDIVRDALTDLKVDMTAVQSTEKDGRTVYYREE